MRHLHLYLRIITEAERVIVQFMARAIKAKTKIIYVFPMLTECQQRACRNAWRVMLCIHPLAVQQSNL